MANSEETKIFTCPMHLEVVSDQSGSCPKCGMRLEEVKNSKFKMEKRNKTKLPATDTTMK